MKAMELTIWQVDKLIPYKKNAKRHPPEQVSKIAASIREFGWDQPIVIEEDGTIIKGHGRRLAAIELGQKEVPVLVRYDLTKAQAQAARIADNRVAYGELDEELLRQDLMDLFANQQPFSLADMGFDAGEIDLGELGDDLSDALAELEDVSANSENSADASAQSAQSNELKEATYEKRFEVSIECSDEADQEKVYEMMTEHGYKCRVMSM